MSNITMLTLYYQQYDADHSLDVPAEAYGGWKTGEVDIDLSRTALVVMHAWDPGTLETHAAWWRTVEYLPRAKKILEEVFPPLLGCVRQSPMKVFHVWSGNERSMPKELMPPPPSPPPPRSGGVASCDGFSPESPLHCGPDCVGINSGGDGGGGISLSGDDGGGGISLPSDPGGGRTSSLSQWRQHHVFVGRHNIEEVDRCLEDLDIAPQAKPMPGEAVAVNGEQLFALCQEHGINHLIYVGFAINWCLLMSPGGMIDMSRHGIVCSTIPEAVTAVENKETAREEREKQQALWRVSLEFGFVFPSRELLAGISNDYQ